MGMAELKAVVLRGTPGSGKSTIAREMVHAAAGRATPPIVLDEGWLPGQARYVGGPGRYADLRAAALPILVAELGWAEPYDMRTEGATRNPREWMDALEQAGREVHLFRLEVSRDEAVRRVASRGNDAGWGRAWWNCYAHDDDIRLLPQRAGVVERVIPTEAWPPARTAEMILKTV